MGWLDEHSGSVAVIAMVLLAFITFVYVVLMRRLAKAGQDAVNEARHSNQLAREANELTRKTIELEREQRLRQQASKIGAWVQPGGTTFQGHTYATVEIENKSEEPVWDFAFTVLTREAQCLVRPIPLVEPGAQRAYRVEITEQLGEDERADLEFRFTDNAGVRWRREPTGTLSQVGDESP